MKEFLLERWFARFEFAAPHLLSSSDCESMTVAELLAIAGQDPAALLDLRLGYTESQGDPELRAAIAARAGGLDADDVLVVVPEEGIFLAMTALVRPGDRVVVATPCYQSLSEIAGSRGAEVVRWPIAETAGGWSVDLDRLAGLLAPGARLLVINFPHNPTGATIGAGELDAIVALCESCGTWLFSDEMYRGLERAPASRLAPAAARSARAISLAGLSKSHGLPGLRVGWLALRDRALLAELQRLKDYTTICSPGPSERLARAALAAEEALLARSRSIVQENLALARAFVQRHPALLAWREPSAGPLAFPRLAGGGVEGFCEAAVRDAGVMVVPSTVFEFGDEHLRLGLGRRGFPKAVAALEGWLRATGR
jgi:aspartate/methionine/tyrosine aminotransferase